ncbi:MAG: hypothetical protein ACW99H_12575, partial [Candidatus Thorarchaeota archaeon]
MRRVLVLCTTFLLVTSILNGHVVTEPQTREATVISQGSISIERDWAANIIVVGYDPALIDEVLLLSGMPSIRDYSAGDVDIRYNIEYQIDYADSTFVNSLRREMLDNSINGTGTGTRLNESALSYQKANLDDPQRIFYPRSGRVIDGYAIEDWLEENPYVTPPSLGYTLYLVNFSEFDNSDHSLEHWYDYHPVDPDTGEAQDCLRLGW